MRKGVPPIQPRVPSEKEKEANQNDYERSDCRYADENPQCKYC